ncbi:DUF5336 domain-containing protein [Mycolicibacterium sp. HK-90]|uniref:DUF5336 domain-containing protein n=1 Tax=Mycolicibacterium sp. HK-90 TaxID=3056937 RepID=UPI0026583669|nr:DUF5336 domain-containing protein [Mycolicibacterium sp. HK-90]WKG03124.1 DUF5336 domain-containing protein [Mycolicibacterium sp. HK-90]
MGNSLSRNLSIVVVVLGLAGYCVSFGPADAGGGSDWHVRFAALAGLSAAIGLLPKQTARPWLTALLAAMGFLDALSSVISAGSGWVVTTIVVLNGLQAVVAIVALWLAPETAAAPATGGYEAYLDYYNQAVQQYYSQQGVVAQPDSSQRSGYGQAYAQAYAQTYAQAPAAGAGAGRAAQQSPQYGDYADLLSPQQDHGHTTAATPVQSGDSVAPPGRAGAGPAQSPAQHVAQRADESARPGQPM